MTDTTAFYHSDNYRVEESVGYLVNRLAHTVAREIDRRMSRLGLTDAQWKPLFMLLKGQCTTAADLSRFACHDAGAVTRLLDRLEDKGLIRRQRSDADRRVVKLELTAEGERIASEVPSIIAAIANGVVAGFSPDEFTQFKQLLKRALDNASALNEGEAP